MTSTYYRDLRRAGQRWQYLVMEGNKQHGEPFLIRIFARILAARLRENGCKVKIVKTPYEFCK